MSDYKDWIALGANIGNAQWQNRRGDEALTETHRQNNMANARYFTGLKSNWLKNLQASSSLLAIQLRQPGLDPWARASLQAEKDQVDEELFRYAGESTQSGKPYISPTSALNREESKSALDPTSEQVGMEMPKFSKRPNAYGSGDSEATGNEAAQKRSPKANEYSSESIARGITQLQNQYEAMAKVLSLTSDPRFASNGFLPNRGGGLYPSYRDPSYYDQDQE